MRREGGLLCNEVMSRYPDQQGMNIPAGLKLLCCTLLSICAFAARPVWALIVLSLINLLIVLAFRLGISFFKKEIRVFIWQSLIIMGLYSLRFGFDHGLLPGFLTSWQLFLAFVPGVMFIQTTPRSQVARTLSRIMPWKMAFVLSTSMQFMGLLLEEIRGIYEAQALKGGRILLKDIWKPWNWPDLVHCLIVPGIVQSMAVANQIALAAKARDFGKNNNRTYWPGD
ncbi:MAG TPA: energy-coupling factor transporter transmembrane component T [Desulfobacteraceae bacterium]|nr:energy-coupling factor transporter transmembrane component T [Desulfobacteraceae bacterium]HPQ28638.1 energy-coupling factor transporter transmembrane component T [Desulfobacteraceae bacterium]